MLADENIISMLGKEVKQQSTAPVKPAVALALSRTVAR